MVLLLQRWTFNLASLEERVAQTDLFQSAISPAECCLVGLNFSDRVSLFGEFEVSIFDFGDNFCLNNFMS